MNFKRCLLIIVPLIAAYMAIYFWLYGTCIFEIIRGILAGCGIGWIAITIDKFVEIWQENKQIEIMLIETYEQHKQRMRRHDE